MEKTKLSKKNNLDPDEFDKKYAKERISIWLDEEVIDEFRKIAKKNNTKYQTLINEVLKNFAFAPKNKNLEKAIGKIESAAKELRQMKELL